VTISIFADARETGVKEESLVKRNRSYIDRNIPVALQVDCYLSGAFPESFAFCRSLYMHVRITDTHAYIIDTGTFHTVALDNLEKPGLKKAPWLPRPDPGLCS